MKKLRNNISYGILGASSGLAGLATASGCGGGNCPTCFGCGGIVLFALLAALFRTNTGGREKKDPES